MTDHAAAPNQKALLFAVKSAKARQIEDLCHSLGVRAVRVSPSAYGENLGFLAGIQGIPRGGSPRSDKGPGKEFPSEMLVFSGLDSGSLDTFLKSYREAGIPPVALKATLTPHNIFWTPEQLYGELLREHAAFHKDGPGVS